MSSSSPSHVRTSRQSTGPAAISVPLLRRAAVPVVVFALAGGLAACSSSTASASSPSGSAAQLQSQYEQVVDHVLPSVVQISTSSSTGSGVVYDSSGDIVTNAHVIGTATSVTVREPVGDKQTTATVVGTFAPDDLAVIRVQSDASSLKPAAFANSNNVQVGQIVLAMGNPLGLTDSVTQGIVSATGRTVGEGSGSAAIITDAIQTSAPINPGNSGGALVNLDDEVLGIPTLAARDPQAGGLAPGIGFAIPSNTVRNIANQLITYGRVVKSDRASLGISAETVANADGQPAGVAVIAVAGGGPAADAGIRSGDIITELNGQPTPSLDVLENYLADLKPGQDAKVTYTRAGTKHTTTVKLGSLTG